MKTYCSARWKRMEEYHAKKDKNTLNFDDFASNTDMMHHILRFLRLKEISILDMAINNKSLRQSYLGALSFHTVSRPLPTNHFERKKTLRDHINWLGDRKVTVKSTCVLKAHFNPTRARFCHARQSVLSPVRFETSVLRLSLRRERVSSARWRAFMGCVDFSWFLVHGVSLTTNPL